MRLLLPLAVDPANGSFGYVADARSALASYGFRLAAVIQVRLVVDRCRTDQSLSTS
jgi:hypothetical protein